MNKLRLFFSLCSFLAVNFCYGTKELEDLVFKQEEMTQCPLCPEVQKMEPGGKRIVALQNGRQIGYVEYCPKGDRCYWFQRRRSECAVYEINVPEDEPNLRAQLLILAITDMQRSGCAQVTT